MTGPDFQDVVNASRAMKRGNKRGKGVKSDARVWLEEHRLEIEDARRRGEFSFTAAARMFEASGITNVDGDRITAAALSRIWADMQREMAAAGSERRTAPVVRSFGMTRKRE